ncbi:MAG: Ferric reductase domain protein transrane component, N-terminal domain [Gemmatimonadetes bacterium]|nr:Ferric reductase domain protein transrane component, N-terminal domain [Gemmatimonadota bacterium]
MSWAELAADAGLVAVGLLTLNVLIGLLMAVKYNPVRSWPHRRVNTFKIHNWTAYVALSVCVLHVLLLLRVPKPAFGLFDVLVPVRSPLQPVENTIGAVALYAVAFVVVTSYNRLRLGRRLWKRLHYTAYAAALLFYVHGILTEPNLKGQPVDYIDGEKVFIELCMLAVIGASAWRVVYLRRHPKGRKARLARQPA